MLAQQSGQPVATVLLCVLLAAGPEVAAVDQMLGERWMRRYPEPPTVLLRSLISEPVYPGQGPMTPSARDTVGSVVFRRQGVRRYQPMQTYDYLTYEDFGRRFFEVAVTEDRVGAAFAQITGNEFEMAPIAQGPGKIAKVSAKVKLQGPQVKRDVAEAITFTIHIPLAINLLVDLRLDKQRFLVDGDIALKATARAAKPLLLIVDVAKPRPSDITVHVSSRTIRGEVLRVVAGVDGEIRRFIAQYVSEEIDSPQSQAAQVIDVATQLDEIWTGP